MYRKNARYVSYEELTGRSFDPIEASTGGEGSSSSSSKRRTVSMEDEEEDGAGGMDFAGEEEDDRFFGDGLTSDQKDILDYVDEINPEEVIEHL